ncbi:hypothetical protein JDV09_12470 [Mycobacterium sp. Y57]|uniref:Rv1476 family membrane protein n=1 Tax=Mycolicibacterium xanthum TaxID=2796469 RepID=UPI001C86380E|nr:DUF6676 family protein [Mycolicibacterium xanthum]MBX7432915.1 hypothetical protein [Mycolicibacterium xanthum]
MIGPQFIPFLPAYIPPEIDMNQVQADVAEDGVSVAPIYQDQIPGLLQVVDQARAEGVDLKIVAIDFNPPIDTPLRDIATEVGQANPGSTVLAMSPSFAGTYSTAFDRVTLEAGEDIAETGNPLQSAENFLGELNDPHFAWTPFTIVVVIGVLSAVVATRLLQNWGKRAAASESPSGSID